MRCISVKGERAAVKVDSGPDENMYIVFINTHTL